MTGPAERKFIFVGGLHRSGTSLLFRMLRAHPAISGFHDTGVPEDEGQLLQSVYPPARDFGGPGRFGFHPESFLDETSALATTENALKLFDEWSPHWDLGADWLLEKSPPNLVRTRFLQALFPRARFLMLLRHPVAVAFATRKWSQTIIESLIEHWLLCHERFAADAARLNHLYTLRYEDLVAQPQACLDRACAALGLPAVAVEEQVSPDVNRRYFDAWHAAAARHPGQVRAIVERYEMRTRAFGYSLGELEHREPLHDGYFRPG